MISASPEVQGRDMPVIWVASVREYQESPDDAYRIPWPSQYVEVAEVGN